MCLAVFALGVHPRYAVVIAANRDEAHVRPTAPAAWWSEGWLGGRDLAAGGTWLGITRQGRWALLTNVRDPTRFDPGAPSRGRLVTDFLADPVAPAESLRSIVARGRRHNGFNLLGGVVADAHWGSNHADAMRALHTGIHGLSNHQLDTPWPKVTRTKAALAAWCATPVSGEPDIEPLFAMLRDTAVAPDGALPDTGIALDRERLLSAPFIVSAAYGTRCSTVATIGHDGEVRFVERSFDPAGAPVGEAAHRFTLARSKVGR